MDQAALILEGGGMRGAFTAGVLDCFLENGLFFADVYGVSAGACQACSYLSRQKGRGIRVWANYLRDKRFCSFSSLLRTGNLFEPAFNYDLIPKTLDPVDNDAFLKQKANFFAVVTNLRTGRAEYLQVHDMMRDMAAIQASASLPLVSRPVAVGKELYLDGGVADAIPLRRAVSDGHTKNVLILTRAPGYSKSPNRLFPFFRAMYGKYPAFIAAMEKRHTRYNETLAWIGEEEKAGRAFVIRPQTPPDIGRIERDPEKLKALYRTGYETAQRSLKDLDEFLSPAVKDTDLP